MDWKLITGNPQVNIRLWFLVWSLWFCAHKQASFWALPIRQRRQWYDLDANMQCWTRAMWNLINITMETGYHVMTSRVRLRIFTQCLILYTHTCSLSLSPCTTTYRTPKRVVILFSFSFIDVVYKRIPAEQWITWHNEYYSFPTSDDERVLLTFLFCHNWKRTEWKASYGRAGSFQVKCLYTCSGNRNADKHN